LDVNLETTKSKYTFSALSFSRWNCKIFPRAETAVSWAITYSICNALGCPITAFKAETAPAKEKLRGLLQKLTAQDELVLQKAE
jgi:hypothetical protein